MIDGAASVTAGLNLLPVWKPEYCKDCKWYSGGNDGDCEHPKACATDFITGRTFSVWGASIFRRPEWLSAVAMGFCGRRGRLFEGREER